MFKVLLYIGLFFCVSVVAFSQENMQLKTIVIDAGHGGKDPGALGKFVKEKDITLSVALKFGNLIKENIPDVKVIYTRNSDVFVPLDKRAAIANKNKANLFVSIHANYIGSPKIHGAETFILGLHRNQDNLEVAKKENSVILLEDDYAAKYEGFDPESTESYIIFEMLQGRNRDHSIDIASKIQDRFHSVAYRNNRGVKEAGFLVLHQTAAPSILVELGFLSNADEEKYLASSEGQNKLAVGLFEAFAEYKKHFDAQSGALSVPSESAINSSGNQSSQNKVENEAQVVYKIQIASSSVQLPKGRGVLAKFPDAQFYRDNKLYKYTVGETSNYDEITRLHKKVKESVADCFIVAFHNGKRITIKEALSISKK
jgi:N-acetylmuramoyl-L-alanine amidase